MLFFNTSVITRVTVIDFLWLWQIFCVLRVLGPVRNMGKWVREMSRICQVPEYRCNMRTHADNSRSSPTSTIPGGDLDLVKYYPEQVGFRRNMTTLKFGAYQMGIELVNHDFKFRVFIKMFLHIARTLLDLLDTPRLPICCISLMPVSSYFVLFCQDCHFQLESAGH